MHPAALGTHPLELVSRCAHAERAGFAYSACTAQPRTFRGTVWASLAMPWGFPGAGRHCFRAASKIRMVTRSASAWHAFAEA
jgi:hypothetical protein